MASRLYRSDDNRCTVGTSAMTDARIRSVVRHPDGRLTLIDDRPVVPHRPVVVGREGDVAVGIDPVDPKVSREATTVTSTSEGWLVTVTNRNGVDLQPWGQPILPAGPSQLVAGPRIALRVKGDPGLSHWILLEDAAFVPAFPVLVPATHLTESLERPAPLTGAQQEAVRALFGELLCWPPRLGAVPRPLKAVASGLGISREAVQRRLQEVRRKATAAGLGPGGDLTDPGYLYFLVRSGFVVPVEDDLDPVLRG